MVKTRVSRIETKGEFTYGTLAEILIKGGAEAAVGMPILRFHSVLWLHKTNADSPDRDGRRY